jgi:DNA-binding IclR family transcriptional regulator
MTLPGWRAGHDVMCALCVSADGLGVAVLAELTGINKTWSSRSLKTLV